MIYNNVTQNMIKIHVKQLFMNDFNNLKTLYRDCSINQSSTNNYHMDSLEENRPSPTEKDYSTIISKS